MTSGHAPGNPETVVPHPALRMLYAAPLPLLVTATFLAAAVYFALHAHDIPRIIGLPLAGLAFGGAVLAFGDALSRHAEYRRVRRMLARHGFDARVFGAMASSRCQRDAALCAAGETGFLHEARSYYRARGYRWHHLLPDGWQRAPWMLLHPGFLKKSFLAFRHIRSGGKDASGGRSPLSGGSGRG